MRFDEFAPEVLAKALQQPLPGVEAQVQLAHPARKLSAPEGVTPREAGVLILLYPDAEGRLRFPLIERTSHNVNDRHRGQIGLPGGKREPEDIDMVATALREAEEEVGADASRINVLGELSTLYIPVSNFSVYPVVGVAETEPTWVPQVSEVARVLHASVEELCADVRLTERALGNGVNLRNVPHFKLGGEEVWGATAMILSELRQVMGLA